MDSAHLGDSKPIAAINVGQVEGWKKRKWYCLGCSARLMAKACNPDKDFDKVAHFALWFNTKHDNGCGVEGLNTLIEKVRRKPIEQTDTLLGYIPYSVTFPDKVERIPDPPAGTGLTKGVADHTDHPTSRGRMFHRPSRKSIYDICRAHAAFRDPKFRESLPLNVEGCLGSNYRDTFYQLQDIRPNETAPELHGCVFYGELRFRNSPNYDDEEKFVLTLNREFRGTDQRYRLIIRWDEWSSQLRALFKKDIEVPRCATNLRFDDPEREREFKPDIIVYFIGQQVDDNPLDFEVRDFRKVAIVVDPKGIYKDFPNHSFLRRTPPQAEQPEAPKAQPPPSAKPTEPPSWVTMDLETPVSPSKLRPATPPPVIPPPPPPRQPNPVVTEHYRRLPTNEQTGSLYWPEPKQRSGFIDWIMSWFG